MDDQKRHENNITGERDDFIVITEFSEREGPISPLIIPTELPPKWVILAYPVLAYPARNSFSNK